MVLPYVPDGCSEKLARVLRKHDVRVFYKPINKLQTIFGLPKDPVDPHKTCGVVYRVPCSDCLKTYVGQTGNSLHTRLQQHRAACRLLQPEKSALAQHSIDHAHRVDWSKAEVVERATNWRQRLFKEAYVTSRVGSDALNRCEQALPAAYKRLLTTPSPTPDDGFLLRPRKFVYFKYNKMESKKPTNFDINSIPSYDN